MSKIKVPEINLNGNGENSLESMYKEYFLDYASYVILERAVPSIHDGLKPVQRRILTSLKDKDDGRYHKVANIIGHTMQYHPHGDAAIGDAMVKLGQKDLLIDPQGNWGDYRTGDSAAAPRYIEARLTKFALDVLFNPQTTEWKLSYDGRNKEPINLPAKFPLVLAQGVEGIAVGLSTKILPHNFIELIKASIKLLKGQRVKIYPDFQQGGQIDVSDYNGGKREGRVKIRATIVQVDKKTLKIVELPYGVTTTSLIDSILKANDKGKIKIKKVLDNTAKDVEILLELQPGVSPELSIDALYAFTNCQVSVSTNACVIENDKPIFVSVEDILNHCTESTKRLLGLELKIKQGELEQKWHNASLEKIFIENRIYRDIEECESFEEVIKVIDKGLKKFVATPKTKKKSGENRLLLKREITKEDIERLTEIRIKRISKYNKFKADEFISNLEDELKQVKYDFKHLTVYTIAYYERLLAKYGKGQERRTKIVEFDNIKIRKVVAKNAKLYVDRKEGFVGTGIKKEEFVCECSDIDDIIAFTSDAKFKVVKIGDKVFVGKNVVHVDVWKKGDKRTTYNLVYLDKKTGITRVKRFNVAAITRDKFYDLGTGNDSKTLYFTKNPNGESELVQIQLTPGCKAKKKLFDFDFDHLDIKGRSSQGNILTKYPVRKVTLLEKGKSTLGSVEIWMDKVSGRLNTDGRGKKLGGFDTGEQLLLVHKDGSYTIKDLTLDSKIHIDNLMDISKFDQEAPVEVLYFEGDKGWTMAKRFFIESTTTNQKYAFISDHKQSKLYYAKIGGELPITYHIRKDKTVKSFELNISEFVDIKGWKALGNKIGEFKVIKIEEPEVEKEELIEDAIVEEVKPIKTKTTSTTVKSTPKSKAKPATKPSSKPDAKSAAKGTFKAKASAKTKTRTTKATTKASTIKSTAAKSKTTNKKAPTKAAPTKKKTTTKASTTKAKSKKTAPKKPTAKKTNRKSKKKGGDYAPGDTIEFDF